MQEKVIMSWSGGKDSAYCLHEILQSSQYEVVALLTSVTEDSGRIKMHGVHGDLLQRQADCLGIPLEKVLVPPISKNTEYELRTGKALEKYRKNGVTSVVFGDLFLEDIKAYRDHCLLGWEMKGIFPLWMRPTTELAAKIIETGIRAVLTCVDTRILDPSFAGRDFDKELLLQLPSAADPCAENGEFHTFVYDAPMFKEKISFKKEGNFMLQDRFYYSDIRLIHPVLTSKGDRES